MTTTTKSRSAALFLVVAAAAGVACFLILALLINIFERKQEAREPFLKLVELNETTTDPKPWGVQWPHHFEDYLRTAGDKFYGGSSAMPQSKLEQDPWLKRLYAGYAFSIDYREARGHAYMLYDQAVTERVTERQQSGACLHCHASVIPTYRRVGLQAMGEQADEAALAADFHWPAVMKGFELLSTEPYEAVYAELRRTPDGTADEGDPVFPLPPTPRPTADGERAEVPAADDPNAQDPHAADPHADWGDAHPVSCVDCHHPDTMAIRVTRPGFVLAIADLAESDAPVTHLPSIERWRNGDRARPYDPNRDASRREMRSFVCGQCHVEYYCASEMTLTFPWRKGLRAEDMEAVWEETVFPSGEPFYDYEHGETGAKVFKAQHPEFELWSQGVHAASGVSCADCHMPYKRVGAMKISSHHVRSPLENVRAACQTCHQGAESELLSRVETIQSKTSEMLQRAAVAMTDMLDAIREAQAAGADPDQLDRLFDLQRKAMWRLDFISSENSKGFHAAQEAMRILAESIDYSRQAQSIANRIRAPDPPQPDSPVTPIRGVTDRSRSPR